MKFYDARTGRYRFRHKGSGTVRDTLVAIGKQLKKAAAPALKKVAMQQSQKQLKR